MVKILALVLEHGGIAILVTHPVFGPPKHDALEDGCRVGWANTVVCMDGWTTRLSTKDEALLKHSLHSERRAWYHVRVELSGEVKMLTVRT